MGIMVCQRIECENDNCFFCHADFGCLCWECFNSLVAYCEYKHDCSDEVIGEFMKIHKYEMENTPMRNLLLNKFGRKHDI
jgi:hypothetical protein